MAQLGDGTGAVFAIANKADLTDQPAAEIAGVSALGISAKTGAGLPELLQRLETLAAEMMAAGAGASGAGASGAGGAGGAEVPLTRLRHRVALMDSADALARAATEGPGTGDSELVAEDLRVAARALGRVTGRVDVEDLLDVIFNDFCIGK
jgi:tRNA modification GTPase